MPYYEAGQAQDLDRAERLAIRLLNSGRPDVPIARVRADLQEIRRLKKLVGQRPLGAGEQANDQENGGFLADTWGVLDEIEGIASGVKSGISAYTGYTKAQSFWDRNRNWLAIGGIIAGAWIIGGFVKAYTQGQTIGRAIGSSLSVQQRLGR